jgi:hypothetical protein
MAWLHKKILNVPVLYYAIAAVILLAYYAWKLKPASSGEDSSGGDIDPGTTKGDPYAGSGLGGVSNPIVGTTDPSDASVTVPTVYTNDQWVRDGASFLGTHKEVDGIHAQQALTKYINGQSLSYQEGQWVNAWIKEKGLPPDGVSEGTSVAAKPAQRQFTHFPGVHTVKGGNDNGYTALAKLYYNRGADGIDLLQAANTNLGPSGPWPIGTKVKIPAYHAPQYFTATKSNRTRESIAKSHAMSVAQLNVLNGNIKHWPVPVGTKVRVR